MLCDMCVNVGADTKSITRGGGAPERSHGAPLEPLAQLGDALGGVGAVPKLVDAAQRVTDQAAKKDEGVSTGADTKANILEAAAHLRSLIFVSLRMAASAVAPSAWM